MNFNKKYTYFKETQEYQQLQTLIQNEIGKAKHTFQDQQSINNALVFLDSVARSEQEKELGAMSDFIESQKEELSKYIPDFEKSEVYKKLNDPSYTIENIETFYNDFIIALNGSRRGLEETKERIKTIQRNINNEIRQFKHYQEDDYRFKLTNDIQSFIKRITGQYRKGDINDSDVSAKMQNIALQVIDQLGITERIASGADFVSIAGIILTDIEQQAQIKLNEYMKQVNKDGATFGDLSDNIYEEIKTSYLQSLKDNTPYTRIQEMLLSSLDDIDQSILSMPISNAKSILNLKSDKTQACKILGNVSKKNKQLESSLENLRKKVSQNKSLEDSLYTITFSKSSYKGAHGNINEFVESIINGGKVRANVAVDLITYNFGYSIKRNKQIDDKVAIMTEQLSSIGDYLTEQKNVDDRELTPTLNRVNEALLDMNNQLEKTIKDIDNGRKLYITHETLKLSTRAERGQEFHGRSMSIFSYISYMCSANLSGFNVGDESNLQFIAYNLVQGAAADEMLLPLEKYFSMFAGMLMFDDVQNMAIEAAQRIKETKPVTVTKNVIQIHLYNLNGLYIPSSMILNHVRDEMIKLASAADTNAGAQAHISLNSGASINNSMSERRKAAKKTKVNITFLGGFSNLVSNLFPD